MSLNQTALMKLPYPNGIDRPCDFDDSWCTFTSAIDAIFTRWEAAINRTTPAAPFAMLQLTKSIATGNNNLVPYDTVVADTAGMTDLDADIYGITVPKAGRYSIAFYVRQETGAVVNAQISATVTSSLSNNTMTHQILDRGAGGTYGWMTDFDVWTLLQGDRLTMSTFESGATSRTLIEAWLAVYWHADTEMP